MSFISKEAAATRARAKDPGMALDESPGPFFHPLIPDQGPGHRPTLCGLCGLCEYKTVLWFRHALPDKTIVAGPAIAMSRTSPPACHPPDYLILWVGRRPGFWSGINDENQAWAPVACPAPGIRTRARPRRRSPVCSTKVALISCPPVRNPF